MVKIMYVSREEDRQKMAVSLSGEMGIQVVPRQVVQETPEELQKTISITMSSVPKEVRG